MDGEKKKRNEQEQQQFQFCEVCKLNHNQGRRHVYFPNHKNSLRVLLTRFQSKLSGVRSFLRTPTPLRPDHAPTSRMWCVFCDCDVVELGSPFACGNAIEHLASGEHCRRVKRFMGKYGGGMDRVDSFRISEADFDKWEKKCKSLKTVAAKSESVGPVIGPLNNIHNELNPDNVNSFHKDNINFVNFCTNDVVPLQRYTNERVQVSCSELSSLSEIGSSCSLVDAQVGDMPVLKVSKGCMVDQHSFNSLNKECSSYGAFCSGSAPPGVSASIGECKVQGFILTQISHIPHEEGTEGNVHTGAPPPWFDISHGSQLYSTRRPELNNFISPRTGKSSRLNPKRVGAAWAEKRKLELELEKRGEPLMDTFNANWLPNFGRVWQSGTRKESRKEFQMENKLSYKEDVLSERSMPLQPYVSKNAKRHK